jgi:hypothetical protein
MKNVSRYLLLALVLTLLPFRVIAITDSAYVGMNNGTGYDMDPDFVAKDIEQDKILGITTVRMGIGGMGGYNADQAFDWTRRDAVIDAYIHAGLIIDGDVTPRFQVDHGADEQAWMDNWRKFIHECMNHCKGKVNYWIIDNEPDKGKGSKGKVTPETMVNLTRVAYEEAKSIDPAIMVESPPTNSPESSFLYDMMKGGIDKYCDYIGVHAYGSQIRDGRFNKPWDWEKQLGITKPISISESGTFAAWHPEGIDGEAWRDRWLQQFYVQAKRYGYDHVLLFDLDGKGQGMGWAYVNGLDGSWAPVPGGYDAIKNGFLAQGLTNGGFEDPIDPNGGWQIYVSPDEPQNPQGVTFATDGTNAHSGKGYLSLAPGENTGKDKGRLAVREVVEKLTPGKQITVSAWVKTGGGTKAQLRVMGYDPTDGTAEQTAEANDTNDWQQVSVKVTPVKTWVVIELNAQGDSGNVYWDDVSVQ